eukprot:Gb_05723 [translate_table: standard]
MKLWKICTSRQGQKLYGSSRCRALSVLCPLLNASKEKKKFIAQLNLLGDTMNFILGISAWFRQWTFPIILVLLCALMLLTETAIADCRTSRRCGKLSIPYSFGVAETGCGLPGFEIICKQNSRFGSGYIPFLNTTHGEFEILNISKDTLRINSTGLNAMACTLNDTGTQSFQIPNERPFTISDSNKFVAVGCYALGVFGLNGSAVSGCIALRANKSIESSHDARGMAVAKLPFPQIIKTLSNLENFQDGRHSLILDWAIGNENCSTAERAKSLQCAEHAKCFNAPQGTGYVCNCSKGYEGDGYLNGTGCKDIDECAYPSLNNCSHSPHGRCENLQGSYKCYCAKGHGDGTQNGSGCRIRHFSQIEYALTGESVALIVVPVVGLCLFFILKRRKVSLVKQKNFELNGGIHLQRLLSSGEGSSGAQRTKIFSAEELQKPTNNFAQNLFLGSGGYGTVYKGTLADDTVVAIKKSKEVDQQEIAQFINEVVILTQINHRNVVRLLGCCLETAVPLLVYEYVSNGTLFDHLHGKYEQPLAWDERLRIATETAEALAYLHSATSTPIVHRDVKSANILLEERLMPKVADFGVSRLVPMGQTHITTVVQGTLGYLDPEYFQTVQLTDKSDVYSFGVVLVELLTSMKAISYERSKNESNLAIYFLSALRMNRLNEIVDYRLLKLEKRNMSGDEMANSIRSVANLAKDCLCVEGEKRPSMKEVFQELVWIRGGRRWGRVRSNSLGVNADENEEERVSLIVKGEKSDEGNLDIVDDSYPNLPQNMNNLSFSLEGFKENLHSGR